MPWVPTEVTGVAGGVTDDSVPSTSMIRSAQTADLGIIIIMKVPIITAIRICIR